MFEMSWPLPDNPFPMPTRAAARLAMVRTLVGDFPGPNQIVIAALLVERLLEIRDAAGLPPFADDEE